MSFEYVDKSKYVYVCGGERACSFSCMLLIKGPVGSRRVQL